MATLKNHKITGTLRAAVDYITKDKTETNTGIPDDIKKAVAYATNDKEGTVTYKTLDSYLNCRPDDPLADFYHLINTYGAGELKDGNAQTKDGKPVIAWHYIQSFDSKIDPMLAHELGRRFAEEMFPGHPVAIGTHTNTEHTHNHFIICAWDWDGKKWHQCNDIYQKAREVSDRLCEEYGLNVLDATRKQKLVRWVDAEGKEHYYEPTDRKNAMLDQRKEGELSGDRIGSYRDTDVYAIKENLRLSNREIVRRDIDNLLPVAQSYEHLLEMLRQSGYRINDKRKDGGYLKHVSFTPPTATKAVRDSSLSEDGYYERESLERVITEYALVRQEHGEMQTGNCEEDVPFFEEYVYGKTDIDSINENFRKSRTPDGGYVIRPRGEVEKKTVRSIKEDDRAIKGLPVGNGAGAVAKTNYYIKRIQESFKALSFMEKEGLLTQTQINRVTQNAWNQYNEGCSKIDKLDYTIGNLEKILKAPEQAQVIRDRIEANADNAAYCEFDMAQDKSTLAKLDKIIEKNGLNNDEGISAFTERIVSVKTRSSELRTAMDTQRRRLSDLDLCSRVLYRIDKDLGREQTEEMSEYWKISRAGQRTENERNNKAAKKGGAAKKHDER